MQNSREWYFVYRITIKKDGWDRHCSAIYKIAYHWNVHNLEVNSKHWPSKFEPIVLQWWYVYTIDLSCSYSEVTVYGNHNTNITTSGYSNGVTVWL